MRTCRHARAGTGRRPWGLPDGDRGLAHSVARQLKPFGKGKRLRTPKAAAVRPDLALRGASPAASVRRGRGLFLTRWRIKTPFCRIQKKILFFC